MAKYKMGQRKRVLLRSTCAIAALATGVKAHAQASSDQTLSNAYQLDQIIITAQKREENLQDVPITGTAFSGETLERAGLDDIAQVGNFVPNVQIDNTSPFSGANSLVAFIRGIGQSDFALNFDPGVGLYVDGVYYARSLGAVVDLLDVEGVEVLKGPQGTLFGRNTIGGAINVRSRTPTYDFSADAELTVGRFNRTDVRGAANFPIVDGKLAASFAFSAKNRDGFQTRVPFEGPGSVNDAVLIDDINGVDIAGRDQGNENNTTFRMKLLWEPSSSARLIFSGDYGRSRENAGATTLLDTYSNIPGSPNFRTISPALAPGAPVLSDVYNGCLVGAIPEPVCVVTTPGGPQSFFNVNADADPFNDLTPFDDRFLTDDRDRSFATGNNFSNIDTWGASITIEQDIASDILLRSISAYREVDASFGQDIDISPLTINDPSFSVPQEQISQEIQLVGSSLSDRLEWLAGLYYFREEGEPETQVIFGGGLVQFFSRNPQVNQSYAAFGQAAFDISQRITLTFGARVTRDEKRIDPEIRDLNAFNRFFLPLEFFPDQSDLTVQAPQTRREIDFTAFNPRTAIEFQATDDVLLFASYATGFKSGGFDLRPTAPVLELPTFDEENADSYEVGFKSTLFDSRLRLNATGFFVEYTDLQQIVQVGISPFTENAATAEVYGAEVDFQAALTSKLLVTGTFGWTEAKFTETDPGAVISTGSALQNTPQYNASLAVDYTQPIGRLGTLDLHADWAFRSEVFNNPENTSLLIQPSVNFVNARITYAEPSDRWQLSVGGRNITNERALVTGFDQVGIGFVQGTFNRPAEWFGTVRIRF